MSIITEFPKGKKINIYDMEYTDKNVYDQISTLFDNDDSSKTIFGVLLNPDGTEIKFSIEQDVKIFAISMEYSDRGGPSGADLNIYKKNLNGEYIFYEKVPTHNKNDGWYELTKLEKGYYWLKADSKYVVFTEWHVILANESFINVNGIRYYINKDGFFNPVSDENVLNGISNTLEEILLNKDNILSALGKNTFKIEILKR